VYGGTWIGVACCIVGDIVKRSPQRYLVTEVLNMWEVSMEGSHTSMFSIINIFVQCLKDMVDHIPKCMKSHSFWTTALVEVM
jgi:hypothetical protein